MQENRFKVFSFPELFIIGLIFNTQIIMAQNSKKWKKLFEAEHEVYWQTPTMKNGECHYVISFRGMDVFFTKKEFEDHVYAVNRVTDVLYKPNGLCYQ